MSERNFNRVAQSFGIEVQSVKKVGGGFSDAAVFHVMTPDDCGFALRKTPMAAALPAPRLRALRRLLRVVNDQGVNVVPVALEPLPSLLLHMCEADDILAEEFWVRQGADVWQAEPWMPGAPAEASLTDEQLRSALHCLHSFHECARTATAEILPNEWFYSASGPSPGLKRRLAIAGELSSGLLQTLRSAAATDPDPQFRALAIRICQSIDPWLSWLVARLSRLSSQSFMLQPVIRDLWRAHVLFTGDQVTGLIDLSAAASDHVCLDLSRLFRSWFGSDVQRVRHAAEQFSAYRHLSQIEWTLLDAFDAATVLLSPITWLRRRFESGDQSRCRDDVLVRLTELTEIAGKFQPLLGSG
jgi:hypothetical protein